MPRDDFRFAHQMRVRYAEADPQGVVFNSRYLEYLDVGVTEYWRALGLEVAGPDAFEMQVVKTTIEYRKALRADELFEVRFRVTRLGRSSMTQVWEIEGPGGDICAAGETIAAHVDLAAARAIRIPDAIAARIEVFEGRTLRQELAA